MEASELDKLIDRARQGDDTAISSLMNDYGDALRREVRFALLDARLRRVVSESDICQSVFNKFFIDLWSGKYEFDDFGELEALLKTMVRSKVADLARHWTAQRRDIRRNVSPENISNVNSPRDKTPSQIAMSRELLDQVSAKMTEWDRHVLDMRREKLTWGQIADRLNESAGPEAVRKRYSRNMTEITQSLGLDSV